MNHNPTLPGVSSDRNGANRDSTTAFETLNRIIDDAGNTTSNVEMSDDDSDVSETSDNSEEEDYALWEGFVMSSNRADQSIFEWLEGIINLYKSSETDELFQKLMKDVEWAKENNYSLADAFDFAVHACKGMIVASVASCQLKDDHDFWCILNRRDVQIGCKWFTGNNCHCDECVGTSLLTKVRRFVEIFYDMPKDDIIQKILEEVERCNDSMLEEAIEESIQRHKEEILERYQEACNLIEACDIVEDSQRPKFQWKEKMTEE